jgi:MFS family permease
VCNTPKNLPCARVAIIGTLFTLSLAIGILLVPEPDLLEALFGDITKVTPIDTVIAYARAGLKAHHVLFREKNGNMSWILFTYSFIHGIVNGIWIFLSIFLLDLGGTSLDVGLLAFIPGLASTFMKLAWGRLGDRLGTTLRMVSIGFIFTSVFSIPVIFSTRPWQVILATSIQALLGSISEVTLTVRFPEVLEPSRRARFMGIYNPIGYAGNITGSFIGGILIPVIGYKYTFFGYTVLNLVIAGIIRFGLSNSTEPKINLVELIKMAFDELQKGLRDLQNMGQNGVPYTRWFIGMSIRGFGLAMFGPILTIYLVNVFNASKPQIGALNSIPFLVRLLGALPLGYIIDRYGSKRMMIIGLFLAVLHPLVFMIVPEVSYLAFVYLLSGAYWAFIHSSWFTWQMDLIPSNRGIYAGFFSFINGLAWAFGPLLGGLLGDFTNLSFCAIFSSIIVFLVYL